MNSLFLKSPNAGSFHGKNAGTFGRKLSSFCPLMHKLPSKLPNLQLKKHRSQQSAFVLPLWNHKPIKKRDWITHVEKSVTETNYPQGMCVVLWILYGLPNRGAQFSPVSSAAYLYNETLLLTFITKPYLRLSLKYLHFFFSLGRGG